MSTNTRKFAKFALIVVFLLFISFQNYMASRADDTFYNRVNRDIEQMEERMQRDGVPNEQIRHTASALRDVRTHVSSYVAKSTSLMNGQFIFFSVIVIVILFIKYNPTEKQ